MGRSNSRRRREARRSLPPSFSTRYVPVSRRSRFRDYSRYSSQKNFFDERNISGPRSPRPTRYVTRKRRLSQPSVSTPARGRFRNVMSFKSMASLPSVTVGTESRRKRLSVCEARAERNEVVHALGIAGRRGRRAFTSVYTKNSRKRCR